MLFFFCHRFPLSGPYPGGTAVLLRGISLSTTQIDCMFDTTRVSISVDPLVADHFRCISPARVAPSDGSTQAVGFSVWTKGANTRPVPTNIANMTFSYFSFPQVSAVFPTRGFEAGFALTLYGKNFVNPDGFANNAFSPAILLVAPTTTTVAAARARGMRALGTAASQTLTEFTKFEVALPAVYRDSTTLTTKAGNIRPSNFDLYFSPNYHSGTRIAFSVVASSLATNVTLAFEVSMCDKGTFAPGSRANPCEPCPPGTFTNDTGLTQCLPCSDSYAEKRTFLFF